MDFPFGKLVPLTPGYPEVELTEYYPVTKIKAGREYKTKVAMVGRANLLCGIRTGVISGQHCLISRLVIDGMVQEGKFLVENTSTNGTWINNEPIQRNESGLLKNFSQLSLLNPKKQKDCINYMFVEYINGRKDFEEGSPFDKYEVMDFLGYGNFAIVRKVRDKITHEEFALKIIDRKAATTASDRNNAIMDEINILRRLDHPNIIGMREMYQTSNYTFLVIELVTGGELFDRILAESCFSESRCRDISRQIFSALEYLHSQNIIHRDLKPENILCLNNESDIIKITDFGLSRIISETHMAQTMCGTPLYVAPEILSGKQYRGTKVDVWSYGVCLYVMACGFPPFDGGDGDETRGNRKLFDAICQGAYQFRSPYWDNKSKEIKDLISHMLVVDPELRYTIEECLNHPFMKGNSLDEPDDMSGRLKKMFDSSIGNSNIPRLTKEEADNLKRTATHASMPNPDSKKQFPQQMSFH
ncbi:non-specific serine/threonine protein kinase [Entamoeba marina]